DAPPDDLPFPSPLESVERPPRAAPEREDGRRRRDPQPRDTQSLGAREQQNRERRPEVEKDRTHDQEARRWSLSGPSATFGSEPSRAPRRTCSLSSSSRSVERGPGSSRAPTTSATARSSEVRSTWLSRIRRSRTVPA